MPVSLKRTGLSALKWSPDGRLLAFQQDEPDTTTGCEREQPVCNNIFLLDVARGLSLNLTQGRYPIQDFVWMPG